MSCIIKSGWKFWRNFVFQKTWRKFSNSPISWIQHISTIVPSMVHVYLFFYVVHRALSDFRAEFLVFTILILIIWGCSMYISVISNEVSSVWLEPGSQGWYEGISMNDWIEKWCVLFDLLFDSHWAKLVFAIWSAWIVSTGKDCNVALRFRKLFQTKEERTKE